MFFNYQLKNKKNSDGKPRKLNYENKKKITIGSLGSTLGSSNCTKGAQ